MTKPLSNSELTPHISIIYVNYHSCKELYRSLQSIVANTSIPMEVIVVENGSGEKLEGLKDLYAEVNLIYSNENLGFAKACNLAVKQARAEFVLLLNPDTWASEPVVEQALNAYQQLPEKTRGVLTCKHLAADGSLQASSFQRGQFPRWPFLRVPVKRLRTSARDYINKDQHLNETHQYSHHSFAVHGSFMLMETALFIKYPFDEDFFLYAEEIDLCRRLYEAGRPCYYFADTTIYHSGSRSEKSNLIRHQMHLSNGLFILKIYGRAGYLTFLLLRMMRAAVLWLLTPLMSKVVRASIKGHLLDTKPFSRDYFKVLKYTKSLNSYLPLVNRHMAHYQKGTLVE